MLNKALQTFKIIMKIHLRLSLITLFCILSTSSGANDIDNLIRAMKGNTPIISDLRQLTDEIGGRLTGSSANEKSIQWALKKFSEAGVTAKTETFEMPKGWIEQSAKAKIFGKNISFESQIAAMPYTYITSTNELTADIVDLKFGSDIEFDKYENLKNKWILVETPVLDDEAGIHGLFQEYLKAVGIENRAEELGVAGIIYMSSRPQNLLYRHLPSDGFENKVPIVVIERENARKIQRLLSQNHKLTFTAQLDIFESNAYQAENVIAEIKGSTYPDEIVLIGAHIDSFDLGSGALDNGSNVSLVIDMARQIQKLKLKPKRTIRFALFNGEEQGLFGSWGYTKTHISELDNHIIATTIDIGTGKINGFFTNGREEIISTVTKVLEPVKHLGPFEAVNVPVVGTDNYDFMMQGVANLVANQENSNYASNYHAESDTFDKVDQKQLKLNSVIMATLTLGFANLDTVPWRRQSKTELLEMVDSFDIESSMKTFGLYNSWKNNQRGMKH